MAVNVVGRRSFERAQNFSTQISFFLNFGVDPGQS